MIALMTDARFDSLAQLGIGFVAIVPAIFAAIWARGARTNSREANANANEAKENSAGALHEVKANGGMNEPDPTLKDYIKHVGETMAVDSRRIDKLQNLMEAHIKHSKLMDEVLAEVYFAVKPDADINLDHINRS